MTIERMREITGDNNPLAIRPSFVGIKKKVITGAVKP